MHSAFLHSTRRVEWGLLLALIVGLHGCGAQEAAPVSASVPPSNSQQETKSEANAPAAASSETPAPTAPSKVISTSKTKPVLVTVPMPGVALVRTAPVGAAEPKAMLVAIPVSSEPAAPAPTASPVSDPGGEVAVKPTKPGLGRVGANACKMCHRLQFTSWSDTAHAKRSPPLDCESCHGSGSEYKAIPVMKDPAMAKAAGLVLPTAPFCATCHKRNWSEGMLKKAHAHKS